MGAHIVSSACFQRNCLMNTRQTMMRRRWKAPYLTSRASHLAVNTQRKRKRQTLLKQCVLNQHHLLILNQYNDQHGASS